MAFCFQVITNIFIIVNIVTILSLRGAAVFQLVKSLPTKLIGQVQILLEGQFLPAFWWWGWALLLGWFLCILPAVSAGCLDLNSLAYHISFFSPFLWECFCMLCLKF